MQIVRIDGDGIYAGKGVSYRSINEYIRLL